MFRNNDFRSVRFIAKATSTSKNESVFNTYRRPFEMNDYVDAFIALPGE